MELAPEGVGLPLPKKESFEVRGTRAIGDDDASSCVGIVLDCRKFLLLKNDDDENKPEPPNPWLYDFRVAPTPSRVFKRINALCAGLEGVGTSG